MIHSWGIAHLVFLVTFAKREHCLWLIDSLRLGCVFSQAPHLILLLPHCHSTKRWPTSPVHWGNLGSYCHGPHRPFLILYQPPCHALQPREEPGFLPLREVLPMAQILSFSTLLFFFQKTPTGKTSRDFSLHSVAALSGRKLTAKLLERIVFMSSL